MNMHMTPAATADPVARRRTFAIISHPDAGKTTLTEKLLLFGGAIQLAGEVKAKRNRVSTRSDWMGIERERGISVGTSVMTFDYDGRVFNLLDTPGHEDFSEDTYRTLTEKLLLYGGAIHLAGSVKARRAQRHATSDWMQMEQERGISVTSSVLQFEYDGFAINLLDTPATRTFPRIPTAR